MSSTPNGPEYKIRWAGRWEHPKHDSWVAVKDMTEGALALWHAKSPAEDDDVVDEDGGTEEEKTEEADDEEEDA